MIFTAVLFPMLFSCASLGKQGLRIVAEMLSSPGSTGVFSSDDDPQLIAEALPFSLKIYEILLSNDPKNAELEAATGKTFIMYTGAFVHIPADMMEEDLWKEAGEARQRAKKLYRRGRNYLLHSLETQHPGFNAALENDYDSAIAMLQPEDADTMYWAGLAWLGMASVDPMDFELLTTLDKATLLLFNSLAHNKENPQINETLIQVYLSLPSSVLFSMREKSPATAAFIDAYYAEAGIEALPEKRAEFHYRRSLGLTKEQNPSPYITMATASSVKQQNAQEFKNYLNNALSIKSEENPENQLLIIIYQKKAQWLLDNIENFFLGEL